jgi:hypothetical protein
VRVLLAALAAAAFAAWLVLMLGEIDPRAAAAVAAALALPPAWWLTRPQPALLNWDGARWTADGEPGEVDVMLDFGRWMLLRFRPSAHGGTGGRVRWLPVPDATQPLRAALYAHNAPATDG